MARRANYGAEKRQKEIKRQKKQQDKAEKKRLKKESAAEDEVPDQEDVDLDSDDVTSATA